MATFKVYLLILCLTFGTLNSDNVQAYLIQRNHNRSSDQANRLLHLVDSEALILTPLIEANKIDEARNQSKVEIPNLSNLKSYSGFFTVNKEYDSNMFFWFFPAMSGKVDVPILLWLQGGPSESSLYGLFLENGPLELDWNNNPSLRNYTWNKEFAMLYIDNPVGAGFSFTQQETGYSQNVMDIAENLYTVLEQFFLLFPEYQKNEFFLTGESFAGKYVPALAQKIHAMNQHKADSKRINLQGLAIGNGFCDPLNMLDYGQYLYQIGLIDKRELEFIIKQQQKVASFIRQKKFGEAEFLLQGVFNYFDHLTGQVSRYNYLDRNPPATYYYEKFIDSPDIRQRIHVGNTKYNLISQLAQTDFMDSVKPLIEQLLNADYRILFYSGQLDTIVPAPFTENLLQNLNWKGQNQYKFAERIIYMVDDPYHYPQVVGYVLQANNLYYAMIRNGGQMLPRDQPRVALDMIKRFVRKESFNNSKHDQNYRSNMESV